MQTFIQHLNFERRSCSDESRDGIFSTFSSQEIKGGICDANDTTTPSIGIETYCSIQGGTTKYEYIEQVVLHTLNNTSGDNGGYAAFPALGTDLSIGGLYEIQLTPSFTSNAAFKEGWVVWIDFNQDGDFSDNGEQLLSTISDTNIKENITIPATALLGNTWMRIAMQWKNTATAPCNNLKYGEIEDYPISLVAAPPSDCPDEDLDNICNDLDPCPLDPKNTCQGEITYCDLKGVNASYEYIQKIAFGAMEHSSGNNNGYGDFTSQEASVTIGAAVPFVLTPGFRTSAYEEYWSIWIDLNQDGDFEDSEEQIFTGTSKLAISGELLIPSSAIAGSTRMRVAMQWKNPMSSCGSVNYGEVEDYTLTIQASSLQNSMLSKSRHIPASFTLYPNPTKRTVTLQLDKNLLAEQVSIYNNMGQLVYTQPISPNESSLTFDLVQQPTGVYSVVLSGKDLPPVVKRFIKK